MKLLNLLNKRIMEQKKTKLTKYLTFLMVTVFLGSCTDKQFVENLNDGTLVANQSNEFLSLIEQAKWGDGQACLKLADCYRDGKGVKKDFLNMLNMVDMAKQYGGIRNMDDYIKMMPEDSEFRLFFDAVDLYENGKVEEAMLKTEQLMTQGSPDEYSVKGIFAVENGDTLEGKRLMETASALGSSFAELVLCIPDWQGDNNPDVEKMKGLADRIPLASQLLADLYTGRFKEDMKDEKLAAYYYLKADEMACLGKQGARWLMYYHQNVSPLPLSEKDVQRLQILTGANEEPIENIEVTDTVVVE